MAWFRGEFDEQFTTAHPPEAVREHFANLDTILSNYGHLDASEKVDDTTLALTLAEENYGVTRFRGQYTVRYWADGDCVRWQSRGEGNIRADGVARFTAAGGHTTVDYKSNLEIDLDLNAMLAKMLQPVITAAMASGTRDYVKRMIKALGPA